MSESCRIEGSRSLIAAMVGRIALISRSFLVPKILAKTASIMSGGRFYFIARGERFRKLLNGEGADGFPGKANSDPEQR